jgi:hypothetical protein
MKPPSMLTPDGRRAWAFLALFGASLVFTGFIIWGLWHLRDRASETFWLAIMAHAQLFMVIGGFTWVLGRRMLLKGGRDGAMIDDRQPSDNDQS